MDNRRRVKRLGVGEGGGGEGEAGYITCSHNNLFCRKTDLSINSRVQWKLR